MLNFYIISTNILESPNFQWFTKNEDTMAFCGSANGGKTQSQWGVVVEVETEMEEIVSDA